MHSTARWHVVARVLHFRSIRPYLPLEVGSRGSAEVQRLVGRRGRGRAPGSEQMKKEGRMSIKEEGGEGRVLGEKADWRGRWAGLGLGWMACGVLVVLVSRGWGGWRGGSAVK